MSASPQAACAPGPVQFLEDKEPAKLHVGNVNHAALVAYLCLLGGPTALLFIFAPGYGLVTMLFGAAMQARRISRLTGDPQALRDTRKHQAEIFGVAVVGTLICCWAEGLLLGDILGSYGSNAVALLVGTIFLLLLDTAPKMAQPRGGAKKVARAIVALDHLRQRRDAIAESLGELATLPVFNADTAALRDAWECRNIDKIESALKQGGALTRASWQRGIALFNNAIADVDLARGKLRYLLSESEQALVPFGIDYASLNVQPSRALEGYAPIPARKKFTTEKLDYGQGIGSALANVAMGRTPWQAAAVAGASLLILNLVNRSKILRQLKDMEGTLGADAAAAKGDFAQFSTILTMRVLPQIDALLEIAGHLKVELEDLQQADITNSQTPEARAKAFRLACSLREGKMFLEMSAGD